jgi:4-amino-4-deoxy-L-arabinose transferase-like glycosyltransferase
MGTNLVRTNLVRSNLLFFSLATLAALLLRLGLVVCFPAVVDDSRLYANIAENWLRHGVYGITNSGAIMPTLSRLPGYPAFLAAIFAVFGIENFRAVLLIQVLFDVGTCFLIADVAGRLISPGAAKGAFLLAALCPFLANYAATALTETLEIFFTALALNCAIRGLLASADAARTRTQWRVWIGTGLSIGAAILLRPDGGLLLAAVGAYLLWKLAINLIGTDRTLQIAWLRAGILVGLAALAPLIPWTLRNLHTFHRFEPLAPRYANDSDEPVMTGFQRWVKTWIADYVSVQEIYWNVPGDNLDVTKLPSRAFDYQKQKAQTAAIFADYNRNHDVTPELDARFAALAAARVHASPYRYYVWLPALRIADMWLRPRTELFPSDPRWWEFNDDPRWLAVSLGFGVINLFYVVLAAAGLFRAREYFGVGLFVLFLVLRSVFLGTLENPETRYTLECYPAVILLGSAVFSR